MVLAAFAPETEYALTLDGWMLLEAVNSPLTNGEQPGTQDLLLAMLVMTDEDSVFAARRNRTLDDLLAAASKNKRPADIYGIAPKIHAAIQQAFAVLDSGAKSEKKSQPELVGGSPS